MFVNGKSNAENNALFDAFFGDCYSNISKECTKFKENDNKKIELKKKNLNNQPSLNVEIFVK